MAPTDRRRPLAQPNQPIQGSTGERKLDIGFVNNPNAGKDSRCHWSQILVPGELKSNPSADIASKAWLDLGRYAREVHAAQDSRRFVLGFTLCGSLRRFWEFDRLGGIASEQFDINKDGLQFVSTTLEFIWRDEEQLGFDPTITTVAGRQVFKIRRIMGRQSGLFSRSRWSVPPASPVGRLLAGKPIVKRSADAACCQRFLAIYRARGRGGAAPRGDRERCCQRCSVLSPRDCLCPIPSR